MIALFTVDVDTYWPWLTLLLLHFSKTASSFALKNQTQLHWRWSSSWKKTHTHQKNETLSRWCCHTGSNHHNIYQIFSKTSPIWYKKSLFSTWHMLCCSIATRSRRWVTMKVVRDEKVKLIPLLLNRQKEIRLLHLLSLTSPSLIAFLDLLSWSLPLLPSGIRTHLNSKKPFYFSIFGFFSPSLSHHHVWVCKCAFDVLVCVCLRVSHPPSFFPLTLSWLHAQSATLCVSGSRCQGVHVCQEGKAGQCRLLERAAGRTGANNKQITLIWITTGV